MEGLSNVYTSPRKGLLKHLYIWFTFPIAMEQEALLSHINVQTLIF